MPESPGKKSRPARKTPVGGPAAAKSRGKPAATECIEADPAPQADPPRPVAGSLAARLEAATRRQFVLEDAGDQTQAGLRSVALARAAVWRLQAAILHDDGAFDAARKASSSANELEVLAAKLERDSLADRLRAVEQKLALKRKAGARLAKLDDP
jgi:hypothetical protein